MVWWLNANKVQVKTSSGRAWGWQGGGLGGLLNSHYMPCCNAFFHREIPTKVKIVLEMHEKPLWCSWFAVLIFEAITTCSDSISKKQTDSHIPLVMLLLITQEVNELSFNEQKCLTNQISFAKRFSIKVAQFWWRVSPLWNLIGLRPSSGLQSRAT